MIEAIQDNRMGGIATRAVATAEYLRDNDIESIFVLPKENGDVADTCRAKGFRVHQILLKRPHPRRFWQSLLWCISFPLSVCLLVSIIIKRNIDVVHVNGLIGLQSVAAAILTRTPLVWHLAGTATYPRWFVRIVRPLMIRKAHIVAISRKVREYFVGHTSLRKNEYIIHEPIDLKAVFKRSLGFDRDWFRRELGIPANSTLVCTVGNLSPTKGTLILVEAARVLCARHENLYFAIVGQLLDTQRGYVSEVKRAIDTYGLKDRVFLVGKRSDVYEILQDSDIFVLPSFSEGTPISILEAMAYKVPVIATDVGGISEQIEDGVSGILIPPGEPNSIVEAVTQLLDKPQLRGKYTENAFRRVTEEFTLEEYISSFSGVVYRACKRTPRDRYSGSHAHGAAEPQPKNSHG